MHAKARPEDLERVNRAFANMPTKGPDPAKAHQSGEDDE
jgi:hypothetical protein